jgi:hypothetical protein
MSKIVIALLAMVALASAEYIVEFDTVRVNNHLAVTNNAFISGELAVGNDIRVTNSIYVGNDLNVTNDVFARTLNAINGLYSLGETWLSEHLTVDGSCDIGGSMSVTNSLEVDGVASFFASANVYGDFYAQTNSYMYGTLYAEGSDIHLYSWDKLAIGYEELDTWETLPEYISSEISQLGSNLTAELVADMARAYYIGGTNYLVEKNTYSGSTNRIIGFRRGYAGAPPPPPDPTPQVWEDIGTLYMDRETVYDWYYYLYGDQAEHANTDTYHWTGEAIFFDIPYAVFSSRMSASTIDAGSVYANAFVGDGSGLTNVTAAQVGAQGYLYSWTAITQAIESASAGDTIYVGTGVYNTAGYLLMKPVNIKGSGQGEWNKLAGQPQGGTLFRGGFILWSDWKNSSIEDCGFWATNTVTTLGFAGSSGFTFNSKLRNISVYATEGGGQHGFLITGKGHNIENIRSYNNNVHGIVFKGTSDVTANNLYSFGDAYQGVLIKSADDGEYGGGGPCSNIAIHGVCIDGNTNTTSVGLIIQNISSNYTISDIRISDVYIRDCFYGVSVGTARVVRVEIDGLSGMRDVTISAGVEASNVVARTANTVSGNFGIGTTTPFETLHVNGNVICSTQYLYYASATNCAGIWMDADNQYVFKIKMGVYSAITNAIP